MRAALISSRRLAPRAAARLVDQLFAADLGPGEELELRDHKSALQE